MLFNILFIVFLRLSFVFFIVFNLIRIVLILEIMLLIECFILFIFRDKIVNFSYDILFDFFFDLVDLDLFLFIFEFLFSLSSFSLILLLVLRVVLGLFLVFFSLLYFLLRVVYWIGK